ncbi:MAG: 16S rRNA (adenine(1518)-N(6)/adenine(1519)-N(6))-dimethyltransferase RsmA [Proteobacteria bacterium]|nr:16S rRNA (adenine(1518)-N(6)/adenine(1519)-N(6))-dimethyltransferase RsmA [Pseudomonadota bacterium]
MTVSQTRARKRFGQHFLIDQYTIDQIIELIAPVQGEHFVEIGPGRGALTAQLIRYNVPLDVIEIDRDLAQIINSKFGEFPNFNLHIGDALKTDYATFRNPGTLRIVGNLPYNISTPLILQLISQCSVIQDMTFMLQKEVVDRLAASPGSKDYGRLSVMVQSYAQVAGYFEVPPAAFDPPPKVISKLVRITPQNRGISPDTYRCLEYCVRLAFGQRRKTVKNSLGREISLDVIEKCGIDLKQRPEEIQVETYLLLAKALEREC